MVRSLESSTAGRGLLRLSLVFSSFKFTTSELSMMRTTSSGVASSIFMREKVNSDAMGTPGRCEQSKQPHNIQLTPIVGFGHATQEAIPTEVAVGKVKLNLAFDAGVFIERHYTLVGLV